jgi:hypothetical protein
MTHRYKFKKITEVNHHPYFGTTYIKVWKRVMVNESVVDKIQKKSATKMLRGGK